MTARLQSRSEAEEAGCGLSVEIWERKWSCKNAQGEKKHLDPGARQRMLLYLTVLEISKQCDYFEFQPGDLRFDGNIKWVCTNTPLRSEQLENNFFKILSSSMEK